MVKFDFDGWFKDTFGNNASLTMYNKYKNLKWHINPNGDLVFEYDSFFVNACDVKNTFMKMNLKLNLRVTTNLFV